MKNRWIGEALFYFERLRYWFVVVNFFMLAYLFFDRVGLRWEYLLIIPPGILFLWLDKVLLFPAWSKATTEKNPFMTEMRDSIK